MSRRRNRTPGPDSAASSSGQHRIGCDPAHGRGRSGRSRSVRMPCGVVRGPRWSTLCVQRSSHLGAGPLAQARPSSCERRLRYLIRLTSRSEASGWQSIEFGIADSAEKTGPTVYSACNGCFRTGSRPPPDPDWNTIGIHGAPDYPVDFIVNYDPSNDAWAWYVDGAPVRYESGTVLGGASYFEAGSIVSGAGTGLPSAWHSQLLAVQASRRVTVFAPADRHRVEWIGFGGFLAQYFPDGSLYVSEVTN